MLPCEPSSEKTSKTMSANNKLGLYISRFVLMQSSFVSIGTLCSAFCFGNVNAKYQAVSEHFCAFQVQNKMVLVEKFKF